MRPDAGIDTFGSIDSSNKEWQSYSYLYLSSQLTSINLIASAEGLAIPARSRA